MSLFSIISIVATVPMTWLRWFDTARQACYVSTLPAVGTVVLFANADTILLSCLTKAEHICGQGDHRLPGPIIR